MQFTLATYIFTKHLLCAVYYGGFVYALGFTQNFYLLREYTVSSTMLGNLDIISYQSHSRTLEPNSSLGMRKLKVSYVTSLSPKSCNNSHMWTSSCSVCTCWVVHSCPTLSDPVGCSPPRLLCPRNFPGDNTGVSCHFLLQGIFQIQGLTRVSSISCSDRLILYYATVNLILAQNNKCVGLLGVSRQPPSQIISLRRVWKTKPKKTVLYL